MQSNTVTACHSASFGKSALGFWVLLPLLMALPVPAYCDDSKASKCMAGICLAIPVTQQDIVAKYGSGHEQVQVDRVEKDGPGREYVRRPNPDLVKRCYYDPAQHLYIEFSFDKHQRREAAYHSDLVGIMVSSVPMCSEKYTPRQPFPSFKTEHGFGVGATEAEVQAAMGKPLKISIAERERLGRAHQPHEELMKDYVTTEYGENALSYSAGVHDLLYDLFYVSQGRVKSILLSYSE